jgi:hypothetical protein
VFYGSLGNSKNPESSRWFVVDCFVNEIKYELG